MIVPGFSRPVLLFEGEVSALLRASPLVYPTLHCSDRYVK